MDFRSMLASFCSLLLVYVPLAESASSRGIGTLSSATGAQVNGTNAPTGTTIFAGDRIVNTDTSNTALSLTGGSRLILTGVGALQMEPATGQPSARLEKGSMAVLTNASTPVAVKAAGTRITGGGGDALYSVTVDGVNLQVTASKGKAQVQGADRTIEVPEGKTLIAKMMPPEQPPPAATRRTPIAKMMSPDPREERRQAGGAPPAAGGGGFWRFSTVLILLAGAGALTGLALAISDIDKKCTVTNASPTNVKCN